MIALCKAHQVNNHVFPDDKFNAVSNSSINRLVQDILILLNQDLDHLAQVLSEIELHDLDLHLLVEIVLL